MARWSGALDVFAAEVQTRLAPLLVGVYDDPEQMSCEIVLVAGLLTDAAEKLLPCVQPRRRTRWRDDTLSCLFAQSRAACVAWKGPSEGPLFEEKGRLHRAVRKRVRLCAARSERLRKKLLPCVQPRRRTRWRDDTLSCLFAQSRAARVAWKGPSEGPLFEEKGRLHRAVRKRVRFCAARSERLRMQRRDRMFAAGDGRRFKSPQRRKSAVALEVASNA